MNCELRKRLKNWMKKGNSVIPVPVDFGSSHWRSVCWDFAGNWRVYELNLRVQEEEEDEELLLLLLLLLNPCCYTEEKKNERK